MVVEEDSILAKVEQMKKKGEVGLHHQGHHHSGAVGCSDPMETVWSIQQPKNGGNRQHKQSNSASQCHPFPFLSIPLPFTLSSSFVFCPPNVASKCKKN